MGRNRPSNEDAPRVPGEEGGRPWGKIVLGLILLLLLALLIPFACQALSGGSGGKDSGTQDSSGAEKNAGDGSSGDGSGKQAAGREETPAASSESQGSDRGDDQSEVRAEVSTLSDQSGDGESISISQAKISGADGWIAIHADDNGEPGDVLGHAPIQEGENINVEVKLDRPVDSGRLYAMVHAEDPADGDYTFPDGDPPVDQSDGMVVEPFEYAVTSSATGGSSSRATGTSDGAPNDANTTGGIDNKPLPDSGGFGPLALAGVIRLAAGSLMRRNLRN